MALGYPIKLSGTSTDTADTSIQKQFTGDTSPYKFTDYYKGGSYVGTGDTGVSSIPTSVSTSTPIKFSQFNGAAKASFPTFVNVGSFGNSPGIPSGIQTDDILILAAYDCPSPTGWTQIRREGLWIGGKGISTHWRRNPSGGTTSPTLSSNAKGYILAYRGCSTGSSVIDVYGTALQYGAYDGAQAYATINGITTTVANTLLLAIASAYEWDKTGDGLLQNWAIATGLCATQRARVSTEDTSGSEAWGIEVHEGTKATAGATGNTSATVNAVMGDSYIGGMLLALRPAGS